MKKQVNMQKNKAENPLFKKYLFTLFLYSLILPMVLKVFIDIPAGVVDYICNSYAGIYPGATTAGLISVQVLTVLAEMLQAGFIGCVLCALLYAIGKDRDPIRVLSYLAVVLLSPMLVSGIGIWLNYLCVSAGISRDTLAYYEAKLPEILMAAVLEHILYITLVICAVLILYWRSAKKPEKIYADTDHFIPTASLYRIVAVTIGLFGVLSLVMTVSDTILDFKTYGNITESLSGVMGYLVLPYAYLIFKLGSMLLLSAMLFKRMNRKFGKETRE